MSISRCSGHRDGEEMTASLFGAQAVLHMRETRLPDSILKISEQTPGTRPLTTSIFGHTGKCSDVLIFFFFLSF